MSKVVFVLSDGLRYDTAVAQMGFLGHLVETRRATRYKIISELPSLSRPIYETLHTGLSASEHGIVTNPVVRLSTQPHLFQLVREAGKTTAAAAYAWFSELYNRAPYDRIGDREVDDTALNIQHGRFYSEDDYPDLELFAAAAYLSRKFNPDYLLVHPMGMDHQGETYGANSKQYCSQAVLQDTILAMLIPEWSQDGYMVLVSSDHGVDQDGLHGGNTPEVRDVPLVIISPNGAGQGDSSLVISQLQIAPTILNLLGIPIPATMKQPSIAQP